MSWEEYVSDFCFRVFSLNGSLNVIWQVTFLSSLLGCPTCSVEGQFCALCSAFYRKRILSVRVLHPVHVLQPCPLSPLGSELPAAVVPCRSGQASHPSENWRPSFRSPPQDFWMQCTAWEPFRHRAFRYLDTVVETEVTRKAADRKILLSAAFASSPGGIKLRCSFNSCLPLFG